MRRLIACFTALLLILSNVPTCTVFAAADVTKPVLESISVEKKIAVPGDTVKVSVKASDDVGVDRIYLYYKTPITQRSFKVDMSYNADQNVYEGSIPIPDNFETGTYKVDYMLIYDTSENSAYVTYGQDPQNHLPNAEFTVSGTTGADVAKPTLESISVDKRAATAGDTVKVSVKASDDVGVDHVYLYYKTPITQRSFKVSMSYNANQNAYEGSIPITNNTESGVFKVDYMLIYDTTGNSTYVTYGQDPQNQLPNAEFTISGTSGADITKPTFESISVDKKDVTFGDSVKVSVKASDDVGVDRVYLYYKTPITKKSFKVSMNYNPAQNVYEGSIPIMDNFESGVYKVDYMIIYDTTGNSTYVSYAQDPQGKLPNSEFRVFTEANPPSFSKLSIDKNVAEAGDSVQLTLDASDDTNLKSGTVTYLSPLTQSKTSVPLTYDGTHLVGHFSIDGNTEVGGWKVESVEIKDTNGNLKVVTADEADLTTGNFTVIEGVPALDYRLVNSSETWSNMTVNQDVYIMPGARLTINGNVTLTGNVYVLGGLRVYGGLRSTGSLIASSFTYGYYTPVNGQVVISGSNSISSLVATNRVLSDVPFKLYDTPIISSGGKVNLSGATVPVVSMEINGQSVPLKSNGTFRVNDFSAGDSLQVKLTDLYGYSRYLTYDVAEIFVDDFSKNSTAITGRTHPNMIVRVFNDKQYLAEGMSDDKGYFSIGVNGLVENATLKFEVINSENELVTSKEVTVKDITAPGIPIIHGVTDHDGIVSGQAEAGASVQVKAGEGLIGTGSAGDDGVFSVVIPTQKAGTNLTVTASDKAGNVSEAASVVVSDATGPVKPWVNEVTDQDTILSGQTEPGAAVKASVNGVEIGSGVAGGDGLYSFAIPVQKAGTVVMITAVDTVGNVGEASTVVVKDVTPPAPPVVNPVTDKDWAITGTAEPGARIEIKGIDENTHIDNAGEDGQFKVLVSPIKAGTKLSVIQRDAAGLASEPVVVIVADGTAPMQPVVTVVTNHDTSVKGTGEAGALVQVAAGGKVIGTGTVAADGKFAVTIPRQQVDTSITVSVKDAAGNVSEGTTIVVIKAVISGWLNENGRWYYYDPSSYDLVIGWYKAGATWYYFDGSGAMKTGWLKLGCAWYYFDGSGAMKTGWMKSGSAWYYFAGSGAMQTGWMKSGSSWYYFTGGGAMQTGWMKSGSAWYYFGTNGAMATGWLKLGGKNYYFDKNGVWRK